MVLNLLYIIILSAGVIGAVMVLVRGGGRETELYEDKKELDCILDRLRISIKNRLSFNPMDLNLNKRETDKQLRLQDRLRDAVNTCYLGNKGKKNYMKDFIYNFLDEEYGVTCLQMEKVISFSDYGGMTSRDKFEILIYVFSEKYGFGDKSLREIISRIGMNGIMDAHEVTGDEISALYMEVDTALERSEKMEILTQRVYEEYLGLGVVDVIRDMDVNGISAGVSGIPEAWRQSGREQAGEEKMSYNAVWVTIDGMPIRLSFLGFSTQKELIRVTKKIYRYENPVELTARKGYVVNFTEDMCRISVTRPPYSSSWAFILRKHTKGLCDLRIQLQEPGHNAAVDLLEIIIRCGLSCAVSGNANTGKTTVLRALIGFIPDDYPIRVYEEIFELWLQMYYPDKNIMNFQATDEITGSESLAFQKKTDGPVNILGEVANEEDAAWAIQTGQNNSLQTLYTVHTMTADALIEYMRNALCRTGVITNSETAERQVVSVMKFDIHTNIKNKKRYIERITEIIPCPAGGTGAVYRTNDIVVNHGDGTGYHFVNRMSEMMEQQITGELSGKETVKFQRLFLDYLEIPLEDCI